jgi:hypothetical protein
MTEEQMVLTMLHGVIAQMEPDQQKQINDFAAELRAKIGGNKILAIAVGLVGAEFAATD